MKNVAIVVMTVTSRTAIQADILEDIAFSMSDEAIQQIERQTTMEDVYNIVKHYILTFTKLIQEEKKAILYQLLNVVNTLLLTYMMIFHCRRLQKKSAFTQRIFLHCLKRKSVLH